TKKLGSDYNILRVSFKRYPCGKSLQPIAEATNKIINDHKVSAEEIEKVTVHTYSKMVSLPPWNDRRPKTMQSAQLSLPFCVGVVASGLKPGPEWYIDSNLASPKILKLVDKVEQVPHRATKEKTILTKVEID